MSAELPGEESHGFCDPASRTSVKQARLGK